MAMKTNTIVRQLARDPGKAAVELGVLEDDLRTAVKGVRNLLFDLRPLVLEAQGLAPALEGYVERTQPDESAQLHLDLAGFAGRMEHHAEVGVFGIVQESLTNIRKHAQAKNVWIALAGAPESFTLEIRDDGLGFDTTKVNEIYEQRGSFGLLNMQERAGVVGGALSIESQPGQGTTVRLTVDRKGGLSN
jgi:signal transduction histidine kinase